MVGYTLISFSFGCVFLNFCTFFFAEADTLVAFLSVLMFMLLLPVPFFLIESPMWLYKRGRVTRLIRVLKRIADLNAVTISKDYFDKLLSLPTSESTAGARKSIILRSFHALRNPSEVHDVDDIKRIKRINRVNFFELFFTTKYNLVLFSICLQSAAMFTVLNGLTTSIQDLGIEVIQINGIILGIFELVGFSIVTYKGPEMRRKKASIVILLGEISGALVLLVLSFFEFTGKNLVTSLISTIWINVFVSAHFGVVYMLVAESFPTDFRGLAGATMSFFGNICGSSVPYLIQISKSLNLHVMVGCSIPSVIAICFIFLQHETFDNKLMN